MATPLPPPDSRLRKELHEARQFALADRIGSGLGELGIVLEDVAGSTTWKAK